jgi:Gpi18-like mannosyltransferase
MARLMFILAFGCGITLLAILAAIMLLALRALWREQQHEVMIVATALAALMLIKCLLLRLFSGYPRDLEQFVTWGEVMARAPWHVYDPQYVCRYMPGYLYAWWSAVALVREYIGYAVTPAIASKLRVMVRIPAVIADALLGLTTLAWMRQLGSDANGETRTRLAVACFALNPALVYTSLVWGQNDSAVTLGVMLALLMASADNFALAGAAAALAVMVKLQGVIVLPILATWMLLKGRIRDWMTTALAFIGVVIITVAPFQVGRPWNFLTNIIASSADYFPYTSLNAFNLMALAVGMRLRDSTRLLGISSYDVGLLLLIALVLVAIVILASDPTPRTLLYSTFLAYLGFFVLPTRIHERYLYFALALLVPLALDSRATLMMFGMLTITFLANQVVTLGYLRGNATFSDENRYAMPIACINLAALAIAIIYGLYITSKNHARWPRPLRAFLDPLRTR